MIHIIDVHDLPETEVKFLQRLVDLMRQVPHVRGESGKGTQEELEKIEFGHWPLGVMQGLTRREIYDFL